MDLLDSILDSMERPPQTLTKQEILLKKQQENQKKLFEKEKSQLKNFKSEIEQKIVNFIKNDQLQKLEFEPMEKIHRTIIHDIADKHELVVYSFGVECVDRHSVVYKKEFKPSDDELDALRKGEVYDRKMKELQERMQSEQDRPLKKQANQFKPNSNYKLKYANIIGMDAGEAAAKITTPNQQFGMVPSSNKRDLRSIEQILNDNKKKKMKNND